MFGKSKKLKSERKIYASGYRPESDQDKLLSFSVKEAYKTIRTNIVLSLIKDGCKIITFTSPVPSEGKSTTVSNIAVSLSKAFYKVLLIDCDLLKPRLHKTFKIKNQSGISNVLSKLSTFEESVQVLEQYSGLHVLTAGISVPNSSEMLGSDRMKDTLAKLSERYDYILLDTPPINVISDGLNLSRISDGVVVVVRQNHSTHDELKQAISSLNFISAKILGIVFNGAEMQNEKGRYKSSKYGKYSSYSYASTYGDEERKSEDDDAVIGVDNSNDVSDK